MASELKAEFNKSLTQRDMSFGKTQPIRFQNELASRDSKIKVAVRIRPLLDQEVHAGHNSTYLAVDEAAKSVTLTKEAAQNQNERVFAFD
jgi:hypothetical protein